MNPIIRVATSNDPYVDCLFPGSYAWYVIVEYPDGCLLVMHEPLASYGAAVRYALGIVA